MRSKAQKKEVDLEAIQKFAQSMIENVEKVIVGKRLVLEKVLVALLSRGHILFEDGPGTGKTFLSRSIAISLGLSFKRLQCTPDLLPNDVTGVSVFNQKTGEFHFRHGPVFSHLLLVDEINRATPRTQSALLEAMGEEQVTVDGQTRPLSNPFLLIATQNPIEFEGTFPLPEAQLDRFFFRLSVGYPDLEEEKEMLQNLQFDHPIEQLQQVMEAEQLLTLQKTVRAVHVDHTLVEYMLALIHATRKHSNVALGISPRGTLALFRASQAYAAIQNRNYVIPEDVKALLLPCLMHRMIVQPESLMRGRNASHILTSILESTEIPLGTPNY